jgi:hypothetical protein
MTDGNKVTPDTRVTNGTPGDDNGVINKENVDEDDEPTEANDEAPAAA